MEHLEVLVDVAPVEEARIVAAAEDGGEDGVEDGCRGELA